MNNTFKMTLMAASAAVLMLAWPASGLDLSGRYPTQLSGGDDTPEHARPWDFGTDDIFRVSQFQIQIDDKLKVEMQNADLGIGHCLDGAVWAVLLPREPGKLSSPQATPSEPIANVWLRFHPAEINHLFPPETVFGDGNTNLAGVMRDVARAKFRSSYHAGQRAMIPEPKDMTVYVDTQGGAHRFYMVDTAAHTAEYVAAFNGGTASPLGKITPDSIPPVVIKTVPECGKMNVAPGACEIRVTYNQEMQTNSWSWCGVWEDSNAESAGRPHYLADHKTCVMKAMLEPGTTYGYWLNTERFGNFKGSAGRSAVPYLLVFATKGKAPTYVERQLKKAQAGSYWAKFNLWEGYAQGTHDVPTNAVEAAHWLGELAKGAYLAKFEPVNGFNPKTPGEMLEEFDSRTGLQSGKDSLGGASFFRTTKQDGKLIGSFLTDTPEAFKAAVGKASNFKLISMEKVTPEMFLTYEASPQESL